MLLRFVLACLLAPAVAALGSTSSEPARLVSIDVHPERLELSSRFTSRQVLLLGQRADGQMVDLTREAQLIDPPAELEVTEQRLVKALQDGEGELTFRVGEQEVSIPYTVRGVTETFRPSFSRDIEPLLSRLGCNAGTCHGSANGKNGFKLSLRGYDHGFDHGSLIDDLAGRRFNRAAPDQSLFLLKPSGGVPHEGGVLMAPGSREYQLIRSWVEEGARYDQDDRQASRVASLEILPENPSIAEPGMEQQFKVLARYTDGNERDVTALAFLEVSDIERLEANETGLVTALRKGDAAVLARYEGAFASTRVFVMGDRAGFVWPEPPERNFIDTLVYKRLREIRTPPSAECTEEEFLRRVHLDLTGKPPSVRQVRAFLLDRRDPVSRRNEVIDRLIGSVDFIDHWSNKWGDLLQVNSKFLGDEGAARFREWVRAAVASNMPYDEFARELLSANGSTVDNPPAAYYKILRKPDLVMENTTQLFLGTRFNCNKCHDHPFERWTQRQHWELAAFFSRVKREDVPGSPKMGKSVVMEEGEEPPAYDEIISESAEGTMIHPDSGRLYEPHFPFEHAGTVPESGELRGLLSAWLTAAENPYFARSYVNRLWSYFLGVGIIEPVDDIRAGNPATNPELLDRLTEEFIRTGFDVRHLMRTICRSRVYQHSIEPLPLNADDQINFSHALARRLPAETLFDAVHQATGSRTRIPGQRPGRRAAESLDPSMKTKDGFLDLFGRPPRESACECERGSGLSLGQTLNLVNGPTIADAIHDPDNDIAHLVRLARDEKEIVDELYLSFLSRLPTEEERTGMAAAIDPMVRTNLAALDADALAEFEARRSAWETSISVSSWEPLEIAGARSQNGATLDVIEDGSIRVSGEKPDKDTYTVIAWTDLAGITGVQLEALPDDSLPANGPGRAENGNFVLHRLRMTVMPLRQPGQTLAAAFGEASADFSQSDWPVAESISEDAAKGWAVSPRFGVSHQAVYELKKETSEACIEGGALLVFSLEQNYGSAHTLGRFRLSVTRSDRPVRHHGLSAELVGALTAATRTSEQEDQLHRHFLSMEKEYVGRIRLSAAQDLAWALCNSPEFLFNH